MVNSQQSTVNGQLIVDAGGTKTAFALLGGDGIFRCAGAGINANYTPDEEILRVLAEAVKQFPKDVTIREVVYYGSGCASQQNALRLEGYLRMFFPLADIRVWSDLMAACHALAGETEAIVCILGTGAASCHYDGRAMVERAPSLGWMLGDEGSGTHLGKCLVTAYLSEQLPDSVRVRFEERFSLNRDLILRKLYQEPQPNKFFSQFPPFLLENITDSIVHQIVLEAFVTFFEKQKRYYSAAEKLSWHFTGSVAAHFETMLREAGERTGCVVGCVAADPMPALLRKWERAV